MLKQGIKFSIAVIYKVHPLISHIKTYKLSKVDCKLECHSPIELRSNKVVQQEFTCCSTEKQLKIFWKLPFLPQKLQFSFLYFI